MLLGRVVGHAVCTMKYADLDGVKLLTVQALNSKLEPVGRVHGFRPAMTITQWAATKPDVP